MDSELEILRRQKRELEAKIRALTTELPIEYGRAKLDKEHYPTAKPDRWHIAVKVERCNAPVGYDTTRYRSIINGISREEVVDALPNVISDLQGLYKKLTEDIEDEPCGTNEQVYP